MQGLSIIIEEMIFIGLFLLELVILFFFARLVTSSLSQFFLRLTRSQNTTIQLLSLLFLPGVIIHELAHLLVAGLLFVPVGEIEFFPQIKDPPAGGGVKLGSVAIGKTDPLRRAIIGVAPVFAGLAIMLGSLFYLSSAQFAFIPFPWNIIFLVYVLFTIGNTMFSSRKDVEGLLEALIVGAIILFGLYFIGFSLPQGFVNYFSSKEFIELIKTADLFMLAPLGIDIFIYGVARMLIKR